MAKPLQHLILLAIATIGLITITSQPALVNGYPFWKLVRFYVQIHNWIPNADIHIHCHSQELDLGDQAIQPYHSVGWDFKLDVVEKVRYWCYTNWTDGRVGGHTLFNAFVDSHKFIDDGCGGRHCTWNLTRSGLYLFNLSKQQFLFRQSWE